MTSEDKEKLLAAMQKAYDNDRSDTTSAFLAAGLAAREFREEGELRCGDEVMVNNPGGCKKGKLLGHIDGTAFVFTDGFGHWVTIDKVSLKPKTERQLMGSVELMQWFRDNGWKPDCDGIYRHDDSIGYFRPSCWQYCGMIIEDTPLVEYFHPGWTVEVEV